MTDKEITADMVDVQNGVNALRRARSQAIVDFVMGGDENQLSIIQCQSERIGKWTEAIERNKARGRVPLRGE